jgi:hypothetical protein
LIGLLTGELVFYSRPEAREGIKYAPEMGPLRRLMVEPPKNGLIDMDSGLAFGTIVSDCQKIATKYANGIRWYAAEGLEQ